MTTGQEQVTMEQEPDPFSRAFATLQASDWTQMVVIAWVCVLVTGAAVSGVATSIAVDSVGDPGAAGGDSGAFVLSTVQEDATVNQTKFVGGAQEDRLGQTVAAAGDVNGDGVDDVLIGAPANDTGGSNAGAVYLFYGPVESNTRNVSAADVTFVGEAGDSAGFALVAGDVNGDGFSDVVVGAPGHAEGGEGAGAAYVVYGGDSLSGTTSLSEADAKLVGEAAGDYAGFSVAVRSVDASSAPSILVGAPTNASTSRTGNAYLLASDSLSGTTSLSEADAKLVGEAEGDVAGWAVAWAGDVTNDSVADVMVGAPGHDAGTGEDAGAAYVVGSDVEGTVPVANASDAKLVGTNASDYLGFSVASAGDVNGDGVADLLVGAPFNDRRGSNAGASYLFLGSGSLDGTVGVADARAMVFGEAAGDRLGWSVAGAGDIDCDERSDVLVGAPYRDRTGSDAGAVYVVYGKSTPDSVVTTKLLGESEDSLAGFDLAGPGDVAGDDGDDVLAGAPFNDDPDGGAAYLWSGTCSASDGE